MLCNKPMNATYMYLCWTALSAFWVVTGTCIALIHGRHPKKIVITGQVLLLTLMDPLIPCLGFRKLSRICHIPTSYLVSFLLKRINQDIHDS